MTSEPVEASAAAEAVITEKDMRDQAREFTERAAASSIHPGEFRIRTATWQSTEGWVTSEPLFSPVPGGKSCDYTPLVDVAGFGRLRFLRMR